MFTGIISYLGKVNKISGKRLSVKASGSFIRNVKKGTSVSVNGVCLTIASVNHTIFNVDIMPETRQKTALSNLSLNNLVNLELPITPKDYLSGHIIYGHVDGTGIIKSIAKKENSWIFTFNTSRKLTKYMIEKGAICINGISLTLISVGRNQFSIGIIPFTFQNTMINQAKVGDRVNIEVDILGKYVYSFLKKGKL